MKKKLMALGLAGTFMFSPNANALDGEIIFRDALYGSAIGGLGGLAYYAIDSKDLGKKVGTGVLIGLILGTTVGIFESNSALVQIKNGKVYASIPDISVKRVKLSNNIYTNISKINLLGVKF